MLSSAGGYSNTFSGSVYTPVDGFDGFVIHVMDGDTLTGARINFGTNLELVINTGSQNYLFAAPAPRWTLERNFGTTPGIFDVAAGRD